MIIDVSPSDVALIISSALMVVLRASRHITRLAPSDARTSPALPFSASSGDPSTYGESSPSGMSTHQRFAWNKLKLMSTTLSRKGTSALAKSLGSVGSTSSISDVLHRVACVANVLALVSNSLTHLLRHSQVLYTVFLSSCDALTQGREQPQHRFVYLGLLACLLLALYTLHEFPALFWVGDWCGYLGGILQLFVLGATIAATQGPVVLVPHNTGSAIVAEFTLERCAACVSSLCYLSMLVDEGEAVYSSHCEFIRWYGSTAAMLAADGLQLWRFSTGRRIIENLD